MTNKRFMEMADRMKNPSLPTKKEIPISRIKRNRFSSPEAEYSFLEGEFGREIHEDIIRKYGDSHPFVTENVSYKERIIQGSKPGYVIAVNDVIRGMGLRTATSLDVHKAIRDGKLNLQNFYEDLGLVLYSESGENEYLAKNLATQIKQTRNLEFPVMLPLIGLGLEKDNSAPQGLAFKLTNNSQVISAPQLSYSNDGKKFSEVDNDGIPVFNDGGNYIFFTEDSGLRMLYRYRVLKLNARNEYLTSSNEDGRVIVCREAMHSKN